MFHSLSIYLNLILVPCFVVFSSVMCLLHMALWFEPFLCEGTLSDRNTREFYSSKLRAVGPNHAQLYASVEDETERKAR